MKLGARREENLCWKKQRPCFPALGPWRSTVHRAAGSIKMQILYLHLLLTSKKIGSLWEDSHFVMVGARLSLFLLPCSLQARLPVTPALSAQCWRRWMVSSILPALAHSVCRAQKQPGMGCLASIQIKHPFPSFFNEKKK